MSNRSKPYRWLPPTNVVQMISVASRISLYLVDQANIMDFTFKDRLHKVNKVHIGERVFCTCHDKLEHCLHSIYVLLRIFKIPPDNPLLWQVSYLEAEVIDIITGKYSLQKVNPMVSSNIHEKQAKEEEKQRVERLPLNQDSLCSICQEPMKKEMALAHCKEGCGNNFHAQCLKIWIQHKQSIEGKVSCPMCRCEYTQHVFEEIKVQEQKVIRNEQKVLTNNQKFSCQQCGVKPIPGTVYKCLFCEMFCLCGGCFDDGKHSKHPFIKFDESKWLGAPRIPKDKHSRNNILDFIADVYPYVSEYLSQNMDYNHKFKFNLEECKCFSCGNDKMVFLRRLPCGHYIDDVCIRDLISKNKLYCQVDGSRFLKGFESVLNIEKEIEKKTHEALKKETKKVEEFLERPSSDSSDPGSDNETPLELPQILHRAEQPYNIGSRREIERSIMRNVQHLPRMPTPPQESTTIKTKREIIPVRSVSIRKESTTTARVGVEPRRLSSMKPPSARNNGGLPPKKPSKK